MSKKKAQKKAKMTAPKRTAKPARKANGKAKARRSRPQAVSLPGMEQVRHTRLDRICEGISESREVINEQRGIEAEQARMALTYMHDNKVPTYRFAGVELARIPGEEKLRIRTTKEPATLEVDGDPEVPETDHASDAAQSANLEG